MKLKNQKYFGKIVELFYSVDTHDNYEKLFYQLKIIHIYAFKHETKDTLSGRTIHLLGSS